MKRVLLVTAALVAAVAVWTVVSLPPPTIPLEAVWDDGALPGVIHIHTNRSDGLSDPGTVASAAARAGLKFVVFTDHGDATRVPDPPTYRAGVLCIDAVEISTTGGHYVVLGMPAAPYRLGGEPRDVVEDVARLGGFGIAAHPDSPRAELAWRDWNAPIDGLEILNPDSAWRAHVYRGGIRARLRLLSAFATYPFRATETIGALLTESTDAKAQWARLSAIRPVVGLAGLDVHAKLALRDSEPGDSQWSLPVAGYDASFRALSVHVTPAGILTGDAVTDAQRVIAGIRHGAVYTAIDAWATPPRFTVTASDGVRVVGPGDVIAPPDAARHMITLKIRHNGDPSFVNYVYWGNQLVFKPQPGNEFGGAIGTPGPYRVEVRDPRHPDGPAWITSNPIYVGEPQAVSSVTAPRTTSESERLETRLNLFDGRTTDGWTIESDRSSLSAISVVPKVSGPELRVRYGLSGGADIGQFAGVAVDTKGGVGSSDRVTFTIRGSAPMRVSIQVRGEVLGAPPERWQRSVYVDGTAREQSVFFSDMMPVGVTHAARPPTGTIRNIIFVVDTTNSAPGSSGSLWMKEVRVEH